MPKLRHVAIIAMNPEELAKFYCEVFEMEIIDRSPTGGVFLSDGYFNVALLPQRVEGKPTGINHLGFHVEDSEVIGGRLKKWPAVIGPKERPGNRYYAEQRTTDPEGNMLDLSEHGFQKMELGETRQAKKAKTKDKASAS